jgi:hypothetical protein
MSNRHGRDYSFPYLHPRVFQTMTEKFIAQGHAHIGYYLSLSLLRSANTLLLPAKYKEIGDLNLHISNGS